MMRLYGSLLCLIALLMAVPSYAQILEQDSKQQEEQPLVITADETLEWDRNNKTFKARKNAKAEQGDVSIEADILEAFYREEKAQSMVLYKMLAKGSVKITSNDSVAYGDNAEYDIDGEKAIMTGKNLKMISDDQTLTAKDNFEYWVVDGVIVANGDVKIIRPKPNKKGSDILEAEKVSAYLKENKEGKRVFERMVAEKNVVITTPSEVLRGQKGTYLAARNVAEITGNVTIMRGKNKLEGARATVDLNTNVSRMYGAGSGVSAKQVRGVFHPGSTKKKEDEKTEKKTLPILENVKTPEVIPNTIRRVRPIRGGARDLDKIDQTPVSKGALAPVQLKKPESMKKDEEGILENNIKIKLLDVPENKTPKAMSDAPLTSPSSSGNALE